MSTMMTVIRLTPTSPETAAVVGALWSGPAPSSPVLLIETAAARRARDLRALARATLSTTTRRTRVR